MDLLNLEWDLFNVSLLGLVVFVLGSLIAWQRKSEPEESAETAKNSQKRPDEVAGRKEDKKLKEKKDKPNKKSVKKKDEQAKVENKSPKNGAAKSEQDKQAKKFGVTGGMYQ